MSHSEQAKWDQRYLSNQSKFQAAQVLRSNLHLLPSQGRALDLACGLGGNARLLAVHGLDVDAWDISTVAIEKLTTQSTRLSIHPKVVDITPASLAAAQFDVITVSYYLDRNLAQPLINALKPGGLLFYQTFNQNQLGRGPTNLNYRLQDNELLQLFASLSIRYYREDACAGSVDHGIRDEALLVAQKLI